MEIVIETIIFIVFEVVLSAIGWICLLIWYRDRQKIKRIKDEKYAGQYSRAGLAFLLNTVAGVGAIAMFGIVVVFLAVWIYRAITD